jgi:hypothetical protein
MSEPRSNTNPVGTTTESAYLVRLRSTNRLKTTLVCTSIELFIVIAIIAILAAILMR